MAMLWTIDKNKVQTWHSLDVAAEVLGIEAGDLLVSKLNAQALGLSHFYAGGTMFYLEMPEITRTNQVIRSRSGATGPLLRGHITHRLGTWNGGPV